MKTWVSTTIGITKERSTMSNGKIAQTKMVTKNGKTFAQQFWVNPDNASAGARARAAGMPTSNVTVDELESSTTEKAMTYLKADSWSMNHPEDFVNGFEASYEFQSDSVDDSLTQYLSDNDPDEVHNVVYRSGFRAGQVAKLAENPDNHLRRSHGYYIANDADRQKLTDALKDKVFTRNPFSRGDDVMVPAGTPFTSTDPNIKGVQFTKVNRKYKVHGNNQGYTHGGIDKMFIEPGEITSTGTGSYWKRFVVTHEMVSANGIEPEGATLGDFGEEIARGSRW
jgi:hypothetical protein